MKWNKGEHKPVVSERSEAPLTGNLNSTSGSLRRRIPLWASTTAATALLAVLYFFPPDQYAFYPRCLFHSMTGWLCPGCGGTRAVHLLLHCDLAGALQANVLAVALVPAALAWFTQWGGRLLDGLFNRGSGWLIAVVVILFAVLRNFPPFHFLAP